MKVTLNLGIVDALRLVNVAFQTTENYFAQKNMIGSEEHKKTIAAERQLYDQVTEQVPRREIERVLTDAPDLRREVLALF